MFDAETAILGVASGILGVVIAFLATFPINAVLYNLTDLENVATLNPIHGIILIVISTILTMIGSIFLPEWQRKRCGSCFTCRINNKNNPLISLKGLFLFVIFIKPPYTK